MKSYCTQNNGDCKTCSLANYGRDCQNNPITGKTEVIRARITLDLKLEFEKLAAKKGMNFSEYLRYIILQELEKNKER